MKVYDTNEAAVAKAGRQKMLVKVVMFLITLFFSVLGIWGLVKFVNRNNTERRTSMLAPHAIARSIGGANNAVSYIQPRNRMGDFNFANA